MLKIKKKEESCISLSEWENYVLGALERHKNREYTYKNLLKSLGVKSKEGKDRLKEALSVLRGAGKIVEIKIGTFRYKRQGKYATGVVELTRNGSAYVQSQEFKDKIFVPFRCLKHALSGDTVKVFVYSDCFPGILNGEVTEVLHKKRSLFVGIIYCQANYAFLIPTGRQIPYDVYIPSAGICGARTGDKVVVEIVNWPEKRKNPEGKVLEILGRPGNTCDEMNAIMAEFDLPAEFPANVLKAAERISAVIPESECAKRRDCRDLLTFTVDPEHACDFDDALSFRLLGEKTYEIGIHIADVSYYVRPATLLDRQAYLRAHSVYLVDRTIPMLPESLSNGICSLKPHQDRLCYSVIVKIGEDGKLREKWIGKTVIRSDHRFTYEEVQEILEGHLHPCREALEVLNKLAQGLREERNKKGALCFSQPELQFKLDEKGRPEQISLKEVKDANRMVEEWMLLANKIVAETIGRGKKEKAVFVYRTHGVPTPDRLHIFRELAGKLGVRIQSQQVVKYNKWFAKLIQQVDSDSMRNMVENLFIRTLTKAEYSVENVGHYGLAFDYYTHFTSPIRRYSDLVVHRLLTHYLEGGRSVRRNKYWEICRHVSEMEVIAENAERASVRYKQLEYLSAYPEKVWTGKITEVVKWGFYVELGEIRCEGLVSILSMKDDYYEFNEKQYRLEGRHFGRSFHLGEEVSVKVFKLDLTSRFLDFVLVGETEKWGNLDEKELPVKLKCKKRKGRKKCRIK